MTRPPPDTLGNLAGRALRLREGARQLAAADARAGAELPKALARRMAEIEPELRSLQRRREALCRAEPEEKAEPAGDFLEGMASLLDL